MTNGEQIYKYINIYEFEHHHHIDSLVIVKFDSRAAFEIAMWPFACDRCSSFSSINAQEINHFNWKKIELKWYTIYFCYSKKYGHGHGHTGIHPMQTIQLFELHIKLRIAKWREHRIWERYAWRYFILRDQFTQYWSAICVRQLTKHPIYQSHSHENKRWF